MTYVLAPKRRPLNIGTTVSSSIKSCKSPVPWVQLLGLVLMAGLVCMTTVQGAESPLSVGFNPDCTGFDQDALLAHLGRGTQDGERPLASLASMVPHLMLEGTALATFTKSTMHETVSTLEGLFGVANSGPRQVVETSFYQESRAVVLSPTILATVAHALAPDAVEVQVGPKRRIHTVPIQITSQEMRAQVLATEPGVPLRTVHVNEAYDLALVQSPATSLLQPLPYPPALSYGTGDPHQPTGGLQAGDCVATIIRQRHAGARDHGEDRLVLGKVLARVPVAVNSLTQTKLNVNMFTTDLAVRPGDSGAPVFALQAEKPVLVGLISATMVPTAMFTYVSRIDPLLAMVDALRLRASLLQRATLAKNAANPHADTVLK